MNELPIFRLRPPDLDPERLAERLFGFREPRVVEDAPRLTLRDGARRLEIFREGGLWMEDEERLWSARLAPRDLPSDEGARKRVARLLMGAGLLEKDQEGSFQRLTPIEGAAGSVAVVHALKEGTQEVIPLDVHIGYSCSIALPTDQEGGAPVLVPGVGGGAKLSVKLGEGEQVVGMSGALRVIDDIETRARIIPEEELNRLFLDRMRGFAKLKYESFLAYHWAPPGTEQALLVPVRVYRASARFGKRDVPLRLSMFPATEHASPDEVFSLERWSTLPTAAPGGRGPGAPASPRPGAAKPPPPPPAAIPIGGLPLLASTYWLGALGGLTLTSDNAKGFRTGLPAGWTANDYPDTQALKSLWKDSDDAAPGVDRRDFVFYTGHADADGWMLATASLGPAQATMLTASESSGTGDRWGHPDPVSTKGGRLRWLVVAACGPLQDPSLVGAAYPGAGATTRWARSFDGLRLMMGYGTTTYDTKEEGWRLMSYATSATSPSTLQRAWLRAGTEAQAASNNPRRPTGSKVYVATLSARRGSADGANDLMPNNGVAAGPIEPVETLTLLATPA